MLTQEQAKSIIDRVISYGKIKKNGSKLADEIEIILVNGDSALTRYANNVVTQNVYEGNSTDLIIRLIKSGKVARATTNKTDDASLKKLILDTAELIKFQKPDKKMMPLAGKQSYKQVNHYIEKTASFTVHERVEAIRKAVDECKRHNLNGSGIFSTGSAVLVVANSNGVFGYHKETQSEFTITALTEDSSGWVKEQDKDVTKINPVSAARTAIDKAIKCQSPIALPAGAYTVILEHAPVTELMLFMAWRGFGALTYQEERCFLSGKMNKKVMGDNITIMDNAYYQQTTGAPFDFEGMPKKEVMLIDKGVAKGVVYDRETALKAKTTSTGHGLPQPNSSGPMPSNLILMPGDSSLEEMIKSTQKGVLVTQLHYTNLVEPMNLVLTGMTRNGTFLVENGQITKGVKNMRFTESVVKALSNVETASRDTKFENAFFGGGCVVPALKINNFNFSSGTKF
jgi:predicted Zn-dependent protease